MTDVIISVRTAEPRGSMQDGGPKVMLPPVDMEKGLKKRKGSPALHSQHLGFCIQRRLGFTWERTVPSLREMEIFVAKRFNGLQSTIMATFQWSINQLKENWLQTTVAAL